MKRFGAALLLLVGLLFGCTVLTGLDRDYVLDTAGNSGGSSNSVGSGGAGATGVGGFGGEGVSPCEPGTKRDCYPGPAGTQDVGLCKAGEQVCDDLGMTYGACVGAVVPSAEVCGQTQDANCDGKLTCSGDAIWSQRFGSVEDQVGVSVAIDSGGNILLAGYFTGSVHFGGTRLNSAGGDDAFVAKIDPTGKHVWSQRFGGAADDRCYGIEVDSTDNVVLTGAFENTIDFGGGVLTSTGGHDVFVAKLDPTGKHVWSKRAGDGLSQYGYGIAVNRVDNSIVVTGAFESSVNFGGALLNSAGGSDAFVVKLDSGGNHAWSQRFGGAMDQRGNSVAVDGVGDVVLTGAFRGVIDLGGGPLTSAGDEDIFVAKLSTNGSHQWSKRFGDAASQVGNDVAFDSGDNVVLAGSFAGSVDFGGGLLTSAGDLDVFVAKLAANGGHVWSERFGDAASQLGNGLTVDIGDNVLLTGAFAGSIDFGGEPLTSAGDLDIFVAKLAANGGHVWSKGFGNSLDQTGQGVAVDSAAGVISTGYYKGSVDLGGGPSFVAGGSDMFTVKLDASGKHVWSKFYVDAGDHTGDSIAVDSAGDVVLTGYLEDSIDLGGGRLPGSGGFDMFVAKLSSDGKPLWGKRFGNYGYQRGHGVAIDSFNNVVLVGYFTGSIDLGGEPLISVGDLDLFVAKISPDGVLLWSKRFGDNLMAQGISVITDNNDNIVLTGLYSGTLDVGGGGLPVKGVVDVFVAKLSSEGDHVWSKFYGGQESDVGYAVATDNVDDIVLAGYYRGALDFGDSSLTSAGGFDAFVVKLSANGDHLWSKGFGDSKDDRGISVAINDMNEIVLTGDYNGAIDFGGGLLTSAGGTDVFITKLSADGSHLWSKNFGNASNQAGNSVALDGAGNIVLTGATYGGFDAGSGVFASGEGLDVFVVKLAANGDHIWSKNFGDIGNQSGYSVAVDSAGNALLTGYAGGRVDFGDGPLTSTGGVDVFVAKLAP